ncbi:uncharacterized protein AMSG_06949 [Thecamonas trahens ATCC 50062]|uniref:FERM domain-containing protein n=1 Tax=Thecamonas trahens ATCC 50062 TaxID=461836 RepID=A0A0L0DFP2_THETB|nr:hypothetical protein AMSG_06949 [Thecamonas trahens ATCC 50062]KNC50981.1 hypothetical protein AMSG_06949 [Thecamonas trahens ATCC 50062]|eukprot:XP_013756452.1 hypothetical protein AMSG_06949 [Thecamonas trahens ATCC 50062]
MNGEESSEYSLVSDEPPEVLSLSADRSESPHDLARHARDMTWAEAAGSQPPTASSTSRSAKGNSERSEPGTTTQSFTRPGHAPSHPHAALSALNSALSSATPYTASADASGSSNVGRLADHQSSGSSTPPPVITLAETSPARAVPGSKMRRSRRGAGADGLLSVHSGGAKRKFDPWASAATPPRSHAFDDDDDESYSLSSDLLVSPYREPSPAAHFAALRPAALSVAGGVRAPDSSSSPLSYSATPSVSSPASAKSLAAPFGASTTGDEDDEYTISDSGDPLGGGVGHIFDDDGLGSGSDSGSGSDVEQKAYGHSFGSSNAAYNDEIAESSGMRSVRGRVATPHPRDDGAFSFDTRDTSRASKLLEEARHPRRGDGARDVPSPEDELDSDSDDGPPLAASPDVDPGTLLALINADLDANTYRNSQPPGTSSSEVIDDEVDPDGVLREARRSSTAGKRVLFGNNFVPKTRCGILRAPRTRAAHAVRTCTFKQNVKIELPDESYIRLNCLTSTTVKQVIELVADQLGIVQREYLGLLEYSVQGYECWLKPESSLLRQVKFVVPSVKFMFKLHPRTIDELTDPLAIQLLYHQTRANLVSGLYDAELTKSVALEMTANAFQATFGDHVEGLHIPGFLTRPVTLSMFLSRHILRKYRNKVWQKRIFAVHQLLRGMSKTEAMTAYLRHAAESIPSFSMEYFHVHNATNKAAITLCIGPEFLEVFRKSRSLGTHSYRDIFRVVLESCGRGTAKRYRITFKIGIVNSPDLPDSAIAPFMVTTDNTTDAELILALVQSYTLLYKARARSGGRSRTSSRAKRTRFSRVASHDAIASELGSLYSTPRAISAGAGLQSSVLLAASSLGGSMGSIPELHSPSGGARNSFAFDGGSGSGSGSDGSDPDVAAAAAARDAVRRMSRQRSTDSIGRHGSGLPSRSGRRRANSHGMDQSGRVRGRRKRSSSARESTHGELGAHAAEARRAEAAQAALAAKAARDRRRRPGPPGRELLSRDSLQVIQLEAAVSGTLPNVRVALGDGSSVRALHAEPGTTAIELYKQYRDMLDLADFVELHVVVAAASLPTLAGLVVSPDKQWVWVEPAEPLLPQVLAADETSRRQVQLVVRIRSFLGFNALELSDYETIHAAYLHVRGQLLHGEFDAELDMPIMIRLAALQVQARRGNWDESDEVVVDVSTVAPPALAPKLAAADVVLMYQSLAARPSIEAERAFLDITSTLSNFGAFVFPVDVAHAGKALDLLLAPDAHGLAGPDRKVVVMGLATAYEAADLLSCLFAHDAY